MPMARAVLITRQAISPRLAMRIFLNMCVSCDLCALPGRGSERDVAVLAPRVLDLLVVQHRERAAYPLARLVRHDDVVDVAAAAGDERVGELLAVFLGALGDLLRIADVLA